MERVEVFWKSGGSTIMPVANLENTTRLLEDKIKRIDYGSAPEPKVASVNTGKPVKTWKQPRLLKYARALGDKSLKDKALKDDILDVIKDLDNG